MDAREQAARERDNAIRERKGRWARGEAAAFSAAARGRDAWECIREAFHGCIEAGVLGCDGDPNDPEATHYLTPVGSDLIVEWDEALGIASSERAVEPMHARMLLREICKDPFPAFALLRKHDLDRGMPDTSLAMMLDNTRTVVESEFGRVMVQEGLGRYRRKK